MDDCSQYIAKSLPIVRNRNLINGLKLILVIKQGMDNAMQFYFDMF